MYCGYVNINSWKNHSSKRTAYTLCVLTLFLGIIVGGHASIPCKSSTCLLLLFYCTNIVMCMYSASTLRCLMYHRLIQIPSPPSPSLFFLQRMTVKYIMIYMFYGHGLTFDLLVSICMT